MSKEWIKQRRSDQFYKRAKSEGYRSRAAFKLKEIDNRLKVLKPGAAVLDVGAAPGGWTQVAKERVGAEGTVVAVDIVPMPPVEGTVFIEGDITEKSTVERILEASGPFDVVLSDASPKLSGNRTYDLGRDLALCWSIMDLALKVLRFDGTAIVKVFQGNELLELKEHFSPHFKRVDTLKPKSSVGRSAEVYLAFRFRRFDQGAGSQQSEQNGDPSGTDEPQ